MKYIKLFIASSIIEFAQERASLSDFIRSLNDIYVPRGIYFQLTICEDLSNAVAKDRKQAEYNQTIREAQYFYILFGRGSDRADDAIYTIEEFDTALDQFRKAGAPKIYTYFRQLPEGESASKNIRDFMNRLDQEIGHYYSTFGNVDTLKLNMLLELTRDQTVGGTVKVEDGMASLDGHKMFSVADIPLYSKNETVQKLLAQKAQLEDEMGKLALEYAKNPAGDAMQRLLANSEQRNKIAEQLHTLEMDVLQLFRQSTEKRQLGQSLNWRERDALQMIDMGNYEAARTLLEDQTWKKEIRQAEEIIEIKKDAILEYISGQKTLIDTYKAEGNTAENARKVIAVYEDITALATKHQIEPDVLYEYASFGLPFVKIKNQDAAANLKIASLRFFLDDFSHLGIQCVLCIRIEKDVDVVSCVSDSHGQQSVSGAMFGQCDSFAHLRFSFYNVCSLSFGWVCDFFCSSAALLSFNFFSTDSFSGVLPPGAESCLFSTMSIYLRIFFRAETSGCKVSSLVRSSALPDCSAENSASNAEKSTAVLPFSFIRVRTALLKVSSSSLCWAA